MPHTTDTTNATAVAEATAQIFARLYPGRSDEVVRNLFVDAAAIFTGHYLDYLTNDLKYHDYRHTLQVTMCYADLMAGRHAAGATPPLSGRHFEIGLAAVLLHDSGYLKTRGDRSGTGAKYTYCHVLRSCALAAAFMPTRGFGLDEIEVAMGVIRRTGPTAPNYAPRDRTSAELLLAAAVASSDYIAQMAATDYPDELELLYDEFTESDNFIGLPQSRRTFKSAEDLAARTPAFWHKVVWPKLEKDFLGVCHFLAPKPGGPNPYLEAVERNIALIAARAPAVPA